MRASRKSVANSSTVGKAEKSSGLATFSATIRTARLIMMLATKPTSSKNAGIGTTISITISRIATGSTAPRLAANQAARPRASWAMDQAPSCASIR